ncbi:hypothetical protein [Embleya sp. NPDC059237]|uniref:hypothetical protein n=1 Tax=Embleya sp. NPDC059237 TaxID=3346784 RepID=UPI0036805213
MVHDVSRTSFHPDTPLWLGLFSVAGVICCLTWMPAPFAGFAGVVVGIVNVRESRREQVFRTRALLGLLCSFVACLFWIWVLWFSGWMDSDYN